MDDVNQLQEKARKLRTLLAAHAATDDDAEMVLGFMTPLFQAIERGDITPPTHDEYRWYFAHTDAPLFKYDDLGEAHAEYSHALEGWTS
ncbi:hypothetical protein LMG19089_03785 [Ralstonia edaphis]|uniref:hypothetical protein n=1 Tax=Ralstonia edaphi TaxID=3058599 RepID=UPI0028F5AB8D|nr:hypothetical protein [Ralstonia sp. LMG 6871]CAJ0705219.1 hypothetical protein LMG19089_03785 [Ralstonia sp. LMG 6871]